MGKQPTKKTTTDTTQESQDKVQALKDHGTAIAKDIGKTIASLPNASTPNYVANATSAGLFGLLYLTSSLGGCSNNSYMALLFCAFQAGVAANQFGFGNTASALQAGASRLFKPLMSSKDNTAEADLDLDPATSPAPTR